MPNRTAIAYNLIVLLYDQMNETRCYSGLDDPDFITYVCEETGMSKTQYHSITGRG